MVNLIVFYNMYDISKYKSESIYPQSKYENDV